MNKFLGTFMMAAAMAATAGAATAAAEASEQRAIDARIVKVKLGGVINLKLKQGAVPSLVILGEKDDIARVSVIRSGDTLTIDTRSRNWSFGADRDELRVEMTLPNLTELTSNGVGATSVQGFSGDAVKLDLDGAGAITVDSNYRIVTARLGGVGSMTLNAGNSDQVDLTLRGAGHMAITGNSKLLRADMGGVGSLDARRLQADSVELDLSGLGGASVYAKHSANLTLSGMGSATVYGNPATRTADKRGMGSVTWRQ